MIVSGTEGSPLCVTPPPNPQTAAIHRGDGVTLSFPVGGQLVPEVPFPERKESW